MTVPKPVRCKCRRHAWTRAQLVRAWENDKELRCPNVECDRVITLEVLERALDKLGLLPHHDFGDEADQGRE